MGILVVVGVSSVVGLAFPLYLEKRRYRRELRLRREWYDRTTPAERVQQRKEHPEPWTLV